MDNSPEGINVVVTLDERAPDRRTYGIYAQRGDSDFFFLVGRPFEEPQWVEASNAKWSVVKDPSLLGLPSVLSMKIVREDRG